MFGIDYTNMTMFVFINEINWRIDLRIINQFLCVKINNNLTISAEQNERKSIAIIALLKRFDGTSLSDAHIDNP